MNGLDLVALLLAALAAFGGWRLGFLRRLSGWVGAGCGVGLAIVLAPGLVSRLALDSDTSIVLICTALMVLLGSIGQGIGAVIGSRLRAGVDTTPARHLDATGGALLGLLGVLLLAWLIVPVMADAKGWASSVTRTSVVAQFVDTYLPAPPPQITELERELVGGGYPRLFTGLRSAPEVPDVPSGSPVSSELLQRAARSVVRLEGEACRQIQSGSGFFVAPNLIATNAHVVAGTRRLDLMTPDGEGGTGTVVAFDPAVDLALVATDLERPALDIAAPSVGDTGLVLGFPGGGEFAPSSFAVADELTATGYDIYDTSKVDRELLVLASELEPGDSGSAVLRSDGSVIGVAVAVAPDSPNVAYALNASELDQLLDDGVSAAVSTGPCAA